MRNKLFRPDVGGPETEGPHYATSASQDGEGEVFRPDVECFVTDARSLMRPAEVVEERLVGLMRGNPLLVSQVPGGKRPRYVPG